MRHLGLNSYEGISMSATLAELLVKDAEQILPLFWDYITQTYRSDDGGPALDLVPVECRVM